MIIKKNTHNLSRRLSPENEPFFSSDILLLLRILKMTEKQNVSCLICVHHQHQNNLAHYI